MEKKTFEEIINKLFKFKFNESFDIIAGIARGGIIPSGMIAQVMNIPVKIININYRDDSHSPRYEEPKLTAELDFNFDSKKVLIVDDVSRSGKTLSFVKKLLSKASLLKTFVINGDADYSLYNEECFKMPWLK